MSRTEAYGAFAWAYDAALGRRFFHAVLPRVQALLGRFPVPNPTHLDLACGTGLALAWFRAEGWRSFGVDASLPMLAEAVGRAPRLAAADMRALPLRAGFGLVTSFYDSLNHLLHRRDLDATFAEVARVLAPGGLFLFDVNHPEVYPRVWGMKEPFVSSGDDHELSMRTSWSPLRKRGMARVSGWAMDRGAKRPIDEVRHQRAWSEKTIVAALRSAGLEPAVTEEFDPYHEDDGPVKLIVLAGKF